LEHLGIDKFIVKQASISLQNILVNRLSSAVVKQSQKLFIGVNEYNTLSNNSVFKHEVHILNIAKSNDINIVKQIFDTNFFSVLK
ncbi:8627_t:CDS:2, partial [Dentiscutata erythropus]